MSDTGRGFDTAVAATEQGLGLASVRERLRMIGGRLHLASALGANTVIRASVPRPVANLAVADLPQETGSATAP